MGVTKEGAVVMEEEPDMVEGTTVVMRVMGEMWATMLDMATGMEGATVMIPGAMVMSLAAMAMLVLVAPMVMVIVTLDMAIEATVWVATPDTERSPVATPPAPGRRWSPATQYSIQLLELYIII